MEKSNKIKDYLENTPPFSLLKKSDILWLTDRLQEISYPAGRIIFSEGDVGDKCYFIESGAVEVFYTRDNEEKHLATLGAHDIFGEIALITESPRCVTVRVVIDCRLFELYRDDFNKILYHSEEAFNAIFDLVKKSK